MKAKESLGKVGRNVISQHEVIEALELMEHDRRYNLKWAILETLAFLLAMASILFFFVAAFAFV